MLPCCTFISRFLLILVIVEGGQLLHILGAVIAAVLSFFGSMLVFGVCVVWLDEEVPFLRAILELLMTL